MCLFHTPIQKTPQDFHCLWSFSRLFLSSSDLNPLLWHLKTWLSLAFSGISPQAFQTLWKIFCSRGGGVENRKGAERRFFPVFGPFEVDFLLFSQAATGFPHDLSTAVETAVDKFTDL